MYYSTGVWRKVFFPYILKLFPPLPVSNTQNDSATPNDSDIQNDSATQMTPPTKMTPRLKINPPTKMTPRLKMTSPAKTTSLVSIKPSLRSGRQLGHSSSNHSFRSVAWCTIFTLLAETSYFPQGALRKILLSLRCVEKYYKQFSKRYFREMIYPCYQVHLDPLPIA